MVNFLEVLILSIFVFFSCYFPGRVIAEKLKLKDTEKFVLSFGFSCFLFYILGFLIYVLNLPFLFNSFLLLIFLIISAFFIYKNNLVIEKELLIFFALFLLLIFYQSLIPFYSGGMWYFDWFEHYLRCVFFLYKLPLNVSFMGYIVPARPPLFNVVCFFYQSIFGDEFYKYQIISTLLNFLLLLSIYLFTKEIFKIENKNLFTLLCGILLLNPYILRQITYTWTKAFCAYYTVCGLYFYIKFLKNKEEIFLYLSAFLFGAGFITHFSAGPYILPLMIFLFLKSIQDRKILKNFLIFNLIFFITIFTYFSWAIKNYGVKKTFLSNTSYQQMKIDIVQRIEKDLNNLYKTILPVISKEYIDAFKKIYSDLKFRFFNYILPFYSSSIPGNLTISFTIFLLYMLFLKYKGKNLEKTDKEFLFFFIPLSFFLALVVNPTKDLCGVSHVTFLPMICLILSIGIKEFIQFEKRKVLLTLYLIETISVLIFQIYIFENYFTVEKTLYFYNTEGVDNSHFQNFLFKYKNNLIFLYDKIFILK
ncbi:MAG: glycosyltransferase family 39 protein [Candidatus Omnitrophica bacterium]|nr:glycosyltransferase family 39 protein [Candidatus Omnitrophota bacterium]MCM8807411.1 glycosyltransferase family 39 protein [Candidatus Omnitrophota bacterium]